MSVDQPAAPGAQRGADPLGDALVAGGLLSEAQLAGARAGAEQQGRRLDEVLVDDGLLDETDIVVTTAHRLGHLYVDLSEYPVDVEAVGRLSETAARRFQAIPIDWEDGTLVVAMANPSDVFALDDIRLLVGAPIKPMVATRTAIRRAIEHWFRADDLTDGLGQDEAPAPEPIQASNQVDDAPIVRLVNTLVAQAIADRASDIHIEPGEADVLVRYRIDGVLHQAMRLPRSMQAALASRLKVMGELDISERRVPQDGRITARFGDGNADLRITTLPTVHGEQVILRIVDRSASLPPLDELGFLPDQLERYRAAVSKPYGTVLVTGPTGSGKTTTLYSTLATIADDARKAVSVEDPVEVRMTGIGQVQVNPKAGLTFATALRSILRADPDIVLVGEVRDRETARIAMEAAITGHLVLSTLHTNDAATTPIRLIEMGVDPFLVASGIDAVVAQRLARRLCDRCKQAAKPTHAELTTLRTGIEGSLDDVDIHHAVGCKACGGTGYRGRFAIHEVLVVTDEVEALIAERDSAEAIRNVAGAQGMVSLRGTGFRRVLEGTTSLEEVLRVVA